MAFSAEKALEWIDQSIELVVEKMDHTTCNNALFHTKHSRDHYCDMTTVAVSVLIVEKSASEVRSCIRRGPL